MPTPREYQKLSESVHATLRRYEDAARLLQIQIDAARDYPEFIDLIREVVNEYDLT
jgi:hypothetical protein